MPQEIDQRYRDEGHSGETRPQSDTGFNDPSLVAPNDPSLVERPLPG